MTNGEFEKTMQDSNAESVDSKVQEGIIRGISFSEFHHIAGPKITCQVPDNFISKDIFDNVSVYIIPKAQLQRSTITMTLRDYKILGFSIKIDDKKYARNAFYFNHCFVCNTEAQTVPYEPVVKKMSDFLMSLEIENRFLSASDDKTRLSNACASDGVPQFAQNVHTLVNNIKYSENRMYSCRVYRMTNGEFEKTMQDSNAESIDSKDQEGIIRCIFFSEFHHIAGPKITCQVPDNFVSKDIFDNVSVYIIPKAQLQRSTITVTLRDYKILGFPIKIDDKKYARNAFYFNLCFVCNAEARTVHYEPVVKKMSDFLMALEIENRFLSASDDKTRLSEMLAQVMEDLNLHKMCTLTEGTMTSHLKVVRLAAEPKPVLDHQVPIFLEGREAFCSDQWDLTTQQVLPYIDGFNHVARIATEADVENNLVKSCVQNLVYYGVVTLIPIFQYSNVYATTPKLKELAEDQNLQERCIECASKSPRQPAYLRDIYRVYASMTHGTSMRDLCQRLNPQNLRINERKLVQFGLIEGLIRRVYKYPIHVHGPCTEVEGDDVESQNESVYKYFTGAYSLDEICCNTGQSVAQIEEIVEKDPSVVMLWK